MVPYFSEKEIKGLDKRLVDMLIVAMRYAGIPFIITSGYRDPAKNSAAGGVRNSAHEYGLAVDLRAPNDEIGKRIAFGLGKAGFTRIGFYNLHIHADIDESKPQVTWTGTSH